MRSRLPIETGSENIMDVNHLKLPAALLRLGICLAALCTLRLAADVVETATERR